MSHLVVSAPGKAFVCGEYAVTEGAPAIVAAVRRRVYAYMDGRAGDGFPLGPEALGAFEAAQQEFGSVPRAPTLDRRELFSGGVKLGLGSSAAGAVAVARSVAAFRQYDLREPATRRRVFECALRGHARVAPNGSGADVAAAAHGGFIRFEKRRHDEIQIAAVGAPPSLHISLVWTGSEVRTSELLAEVQRLRRDDPSSYERAMTALARCANEFAAAFSRGRQVEVVEAARRYHAAMKHLGRAAGIPIVNDALDRIADRAAEAGGAAKPSGAGGGDIAIAFFPTPEASHRFHQGTGSPLKNLTIPIT